MYVKRLNQDAVLPKRSTSGAAGYDLCASEDISIQHNCGRCDVKTGLMIVLPTGCYGRIAPRSGLALNYGINVGAGVIDEDFRGEIKVILFNHGSSDFQVRKGDRIAQLILEQILTPNVVEIEDGTEQTERNNEGFGSSGIRPLSQPFRFGRSFKNEQDL